jgi:hypothetical protein
LGFMAISATRKAGKSTESNHHALSSTARFIGVRRPRSARRPRPRSTASGRRTSKRPCGGCSRRARSRLRPMDRPAVARPAW